MSAIYSAILTNAGQAKLANALALGVPLKITHMAVGDGNGQPVTPNAAQTALVREQRRAPINTLFQDPNNQSQLVAEQIIPEDVGDWWIREAGIFSEDGTLIAIANTPDTYKPLLSSGAGRTQVIRIVLIVSDTSAVELKIDPSVVLATRKYVADLMAAHKQSREHPDASETEKGFTRYATQIEVNETVTANQKADVVVTVKTLWGWVKQASETVLGMMKVATQQQTDTGSADDVAITPKKLRSGFASLMSQNGYIALPTWMGGVVIQWGRTPDSIAGADIVVTLPITFPREVYSIAFAGDTYQGAENFNRSITELGRGSFKYSAMATGLSTKYAGYGCYYIAIGR
ncbi:phage tail protein [Aeromonas caviae]|uniref:phage tail protein n=1 Tax=Aeromonas caviae TaxID=648 RepID=UPI00244D78FD|nr:phage tail protein [Aeromonas caviae]MDH1850068.1 phage tail protein [Aeromonas caviae]